MHARHLLGLHKKAVNEPTARFIFVPKTRGKARGICAEQNESQVLQQAVASVLRDRIESCYLSKHIDITDQSKNASAALAGSVTKRTCTMDMSDASDRISRDLVAWIFQDTPLYAPLMALSTKWVIPPLECPEPRTPIRVNKYAPMGSGLCFPVMSLVHFYLLKGIAALRLQRNLTRFSDMDLRVYGDDLIVTADLYDHVADIFPKFGLKLNLSKSYKMSHFRESCGIHAFMGVDITPVYVRHTPIINRSDTLVSLLATEELLFNRGLNSTAEFVRRACMRVFDNIDYVPAGTDLIGFKRRMSPADALRSIRYLRAKRKYDRDSQTTMVRVRVARKRKQQACLTDDHACLRWHWMKPEKPRLVDDSVGELTIAYRWTSESALCGVVSPLIAQ